MNLVWAVDMADGEPALVLALLAGHDEEVLHTPGRVVNRLGAGYRREGRTEACDAIADRARISW
ncbi:hypothetical protein ACFXPY_37810 [Streptomyces sp. NPDC059153]|uniref:hypothetical protein n=1 Tax=unclassified Streptomyces TaxID=2593676 RepID=UPI0036CB3F65